MFGEDKICKLFEFLLCYFEIDWYIIIAAIMWVHSRHDVHLSFKELTIDFKVNCWVVLCQRQKLAWYVWIRQYFEDLHLIRVSRITGDLWHFFRRINSVSLLEIAQWSCVFYRKLNLTAHYIGSILRKLLQSALTTGNDWYSCIFRSLIFELI